MSTPRTRIGDARPPPRVPVLPAVRLRRWSEQDLAALVAVLGAAREHLRPWMAWVRLHDEDPVAASAQFLATQGSAWAAGDAFGYALEEGGRIVGCASLENRIGAGGLEVGYWLAPDATGRGLMTAAVRELAAAGLALDGVQRIEIRHDVANARSGAVPRRLGWRRTAEHPRAVEAPGESGTTAVWETTG